MPLTSEIATKRGILLDRPHISRACYVGKRLVGVGGLYWRDGLCWLWLDGVDRKRTRPLVVVRTAKEMMARAWAVGERAVFAARDDTPMSLKLMLLLGAQRLPDHPDFGGVEIWKWSAPS